MSKEVVQASAQEWRFKSPSRIVSRTAAATLIAASMLPFDTSPRANAQSPESESILQLNQLSQKDTSVDEQISDFLSDEKIRALLAATAAFSIAAGTNAFLQSRRNDETKLQVLRNTGSILGTVAVGSLLVDSFQTIPREIPASLFAGYTLMQAGYGILNTFENYHDPKLRASAIAAGTSFVLVGIGSIVATHNM